jgi:hypothetical protein
MPNNEEDLLAGETVPPFEWRVSRIHVSLNEPDLAALIEFRDLETGTELRFPFTREAALELAALLNRRWSRRLSRLGV